MGRIASVDFARAAEIALDGVASRAQLLGAGIAPATMSRRSRPGGPWRRLLPGVYLLGRGEPTRRQQVRAALLYAGEPSAVTGIEAARRHGVQRLPEDGRVHVLVPHESHVSSRDFLLVERTRRAVSVQSRDGIPVAAPPRCLVDAARRLSRLDEVRALLADAVQRSICGVDDLVAEVTCQGLPGAALPRLVLAEVADGVRSAAEAWARSLVYRSGRVPQPRWNVAVRTREGRLLAVVDAWWDEVALAWQIDSREFHLDPAGYDRTLRRQSALAAAGVIVVHTVPSRLRADSSAVLEEIISAYWQASRRKPRPDVQATPWP